MVYRKDPEGAFDYRSSDGSHSVPLPLTVFPAHFRMLFSPSTQDKRHGSGVILQYCLQLKNLHGFRGSHVRKRRIPASFLAVQNFAKGV